MNKKRGIEFLIPAFLICIIVVPFVVGSYLYPDLEIQEPRVLEVEVVPEVVVETPKVEETLHTELPEEVRGIYWTAFTAISSRADQLLQYMIDTGLNTVVIDVKMDNGQLVEVERFEEILTQLYEARIYRIARIAVMRDGAFALENPDIALRSTSGGFWYDSIGSIWVDPAAPEVADYAIELGEQFYEAGFDEIQYDYVRFASDGVISAIVYPVYNGTQAKTQVMREFFKRVGGSMQALEIPVSFDVFGMTFWSHYDYNIGQRLADVLPYSDWVSPMVYPSHYPSGFEGFANPAENPYEIVKRSLDEGTHLLLGVYAGSEEELRSRFRPWLQDFDIGAVYTSALIEAQIQASRDAGASGWILWNARNVYEPADYY